MVQAKRTLFQTNSLYGVAIICGRDYIFGLCIYCD